MINPITKQKPKANHAYKDAINQSIMSVRSIPMPMKQRPLPIISRVWGIRILRLGVA
jgi:hypothetical protein